MNFFPKYVDVDVHRRINLSERRRLNRYCIKMLYVDDSGKCRRSSAQCIKELKAPEIPFLLCHYKKTNNNNNKTPAQSRNRSFHPRDIARTFFEQTIIHFWTIFFEKMTKKCPKTWFCMKNTTFSELSYCSIRDLCHLGGSKNDHFWTKMTHFWPIFDPFWTIFGSKNHFFSTRFCGFKPTDL